MRQVNLGIVLLAALIANSTALATEPQLVKDVNARALQRDSLCGNPVPVNGVAYFCGADDQLWMTDGTEAGTKPVRLIDGIIVESASRLTASGPLLYFLLGRELWRTDGTPRGTFRLLDGQAGTNAFLMTNVDDELYFFSRGELWKSDGTSEGTVLVRAFGNTLRPNDTAALNGALYFTNYQHEFWTSDSTAAGTRMLRNIDGVNLEDNDNNLTNVHGTLYFSMENINRQRDLWKSDGTAAGTVLVKSNVSDRFFDLDNFTDVSGKLFFTAESNYSDTVIWTTDGSSDGTVVVRKLSGISQSATVARGVGDTFLLGTRQDGLWRSDGTTQGTFVLTTDFAPSSASSIAVHQGLAYFAAENGSGLGSELWASDGSLVGTRLVRDIHRQHYDSKPQYMASIDTGLVFQANSGQRFGGPSLWISDGTKKGTRQVKDLSNFTWGAYPSLSTVAGDNLYFVANMRRSPFWRSTWELWRSDGTEPGTQAVLDLLDEQAQPYETYRKEWAELEAVAGVLYVSGRDAAGWGLWRIAGPSSAPLALSNVVPMAPVQPVSDLTQYHGTLYFFSDTPSGRALWRLDNGETAARLVRDGLVDPGSLSIVQDRLVFVNNGDELWWSDGSTQGTQQITVLGVGADASISLLQNFNEGFSFQLNWDFVFYGQSPGRPLRSAFWISDGTAAGTRQLRRPYPDGLNVLNRGIVYSRNEGLWLTHGDSLGAQFASLREIRNVTRLGNRIYFSAAPNQALWRSDGTSAGTQMVTDGVEIQAMTVLNGELYLAATEVGTRQEALFVSDGSASGTRKVQPGLQYLRPLESARNRFLGFSDSGWQIWESDGTQAGTRQLSSFQRSSRIGPFLREPFEFAVNDRLMLVVSDGEHSAEWWGLDASDPGAALMGDYLWLDANENGVQDSTEPGMAGVQVTLETCAGQTLATTLSDSDGAYRFDALSPANYRVRFTAPQGYSFSPPRAADYRIDSDPDPETGAIRCTALAKGQKRHGIDAGLILRQAATLGDRVWHDLDGNGLQDAGEPGMLNVEVRLESCDGTVLHATRTNSEGAFLFDDVVNGEYRLHYLAPTGYRFSPKNQLDDFRVDSNAHPVTGLDSCRHIRNGQLRVALDAGLVRQ